MADLAAINDAFQRACETAATKTEARVVSFILRTQLSPDQITLVSFPRKLAMYPQWSGAVALLPQAPRAGND